MVENVLCQIKNNPWNRAKRRTFLEIHIKIAITTLSTNLQCNIVKTDFLEFKAFNNDSLKMDLQLILIRYISNIRVDIKFHTHFLYFLYGYILDYSVKKS